jgi:ribonuclease P protein component
LPSEDGRLPKYLVLKKRIEIKDIFNNGQFDRRKHVFVYKLPSTNNKIGFFVNRRCGNAVARNKIKRWLREIYRLNKSHFEGYHVVLYVKKPISYDYNDLKIDILSKPL